MRVFPGLRRRLAPVALLFCSALSFGCDGLPAGQTLWIRLSSPVSSYSSKPGDPVHAVLIEAITCENETILPIGTSIEGTVHSVRKVGWGIEHETAALDLRFTRAVVTPDSSLAMTATVAEVENAREQVSTKGVIQGIRSSDSPQGRINSRLRHLPTLNPYSDVGLIAFKAAFPIFPEPEIYFPAGTDVRIRLKEPIRAPAAAAVQPVESAVVSNEELDVERAVSSLPERSTTPAMLNADVVNLAFVGSRQEVEDAFRQAGWSTSDTFTKRSFMHDFYAFLNNSGYAQAPMRPFLLEGKSEDMSWQKSLNSYARRDHLRIWQWSQAPQVETADARTIWLSSSTHDTGATLSLRRHQFIHHIAPDIDEERSKIIRDLQVAGCVESVHMAPRPGMSNLTQNANGDPVRTDGDLAIVLLKPCQPVVPGLAANTAQTKFKAGNHVFRYFRRQILTFRSDIWRANIIYGIYDLGRMSVEAMRHHPVPPPMQQAKAFVKPAETDLKPAQIEGQP